MFDIAQNTLKEFVGASTGAVYKYRPVPQCYKTEVNMVVSRNASKALRNSNGGDAHEVATMSATEIMIEKRAELLYLLLRVCLRSVHGIMNDGKPVSVILEDSEVGGINTKIVKKENIDFLLEAGVIGDELAELVDVIENSINLTDEDKKKSEVSDVGDVERSQESM